MIILTYQTPWEATWQCDPQEEAWLVKQFTFKDLSDTLHRSRFGYFPEVVTVDRGTKRLTHGQAIYVARQAKGDGRQVEVQDRFPRLLVETGTIAADYLPGVTLRDYQQLAIQIVAGKGHGIVQIATSGGKTVVMGGLLKTLLEQTTAGLMIMIFSKDLLNQTARRFISYGVPSDDIGIIHSDISPEEQGANAKKRVVLTTHLSIEKFPGTIARTQYVLVDEAHMAMGPLWSAMLAKMPNLTNVIGFTATPWDTTDEFHKMIALFGQVLIDIPVSYLVKRGLVMNPHIIFVKMVYENRDKALIKALSWQKAEQQFIFEDENRSMLAVAALRKWGGRMLVLYDNLKHGRKMEELFKPHFPTRLVEGKHSTETREDAIKWFEQDCLPGEAGKVLLGSEIFEQGVDLAGGCDILFIAGSSKKRRKNVQRLGRALRLNRSGTLRVIVPWDGNHPKLAKWSGEKKKLFVDLGFEDRIQVVSLPEFVQMSDFITLV